MNISVILAAGEGTRMKSKHSKVVHRILGCTLVEHVLNTAEAAGIEKNIVVIKSEGDEVRDVLGSRAILVEQPVGEGAPYGTGYALICAMDQIEDTDNVVILAGDAPLINAETLRAMMSYKLKKHADAAVLTAILPDGGAYGRIVRNKDNYLEKIVEFKDATDEEKLIREVNSGMYVFNGALLKEALKSLDTNNSAGEYLLTDTIDYAVSKGHTVIAFPASNADEIRGVNSRKELAIAAEILKERVNEYHMGNGVTLLDPKNTYIDMGVRIAPDVIVEPGVFLEGHTVIEEDVILRSGSRIRNSTIGRGTVIESSVIEDSTVGESCDIGPFAHIRPNSALKDHVHLGNFTEVKNSTVAKGTKAGHLTYIGDCDVGENVNFGCGTILVNYDGKVKHRSKIGDHVFIGCNANIVSPCTIEDGAYIAAGTTVVDNVPEDSLAIGRVRQENKEGWTLKKGLSNK